MENGINVMKLKNKQENYYTCHLNKATALGTDWFIQTCTDVPNV